MKKILDAFLLAESEEQIGAAKHERIAMIEMVIQGVSTRKVTR